MLMIIIMTIMNMQNELYTIQFSHHLMTSLQQSPGSNHGTQNSQILRVLQYSRTRPNSQISSAPGQERIQTYGKWEAKIPAPWKIPICIVIMRSYGMEYFHWTAWAGCLALLPPSSCPPAYQMSMGNWKVFGFLATTTNISVINILLVLNPKHSTYWEQIYSIAAKTRTCAYIITSLF